MEDNRLPKQLLNYHPKGRRRPGRPLKRLLDDMTAETETGRPGLNSWWNMMMMILQVQQQNTLTLFTNFKLLTLFTSGLYLWLFLCLLLISTMFLYNFLIILSYIQYNNQFRLSFLTLSQYWLSLHTKHT
jgi:hypothetical protein